MEDFTSNHARECFAEITGQFEDMAASAMRGQSLSFTLADAQKLHTELVFRLKKVSAWFEKIEENLE